MKPGLFQNPEHAGFHQKRSKKKPDRISPGPGEYKIDNNSIEYEMYLYNKNIIKGLYDKTPNIKYICNIVENGYYIKPYFSEELKDKYNNPYHIDYYEDIEGNNDTKKYVKNNDIISI